MTRLALAAALALCLGGCALPPLVAVAIGSAAAGATITAVHDCKQDGGCKSIPLLP